MCLCDGVVCVGGCGGRLVLSFACHSSSTLFHLATHKRAKMPSCLHSDPSFSFVMYSADRVHFMYDKTNRPSGEVYVEVATEDLFK